MQVLKGIVILMAVVLVVGFTALIIKWQDKREEIAARAQPSTPVAAAMAGEAVTVAPAEEVTVPLPEGARVLQTDAAGNIVDVLVQNADGSRDLYQVSRADGGVMGIIHFRHEAK